MSAWQKIDTAPRNPPRDILVFCPAKDPPRREIFLAWWAIPYENAPLKQGWWCYDGNKTIKGIKRHVLTCSLGFVLASLVTAANVHDTQAAGLLFDRAVQNGWVLERVKVDGIYVGPRMAQAAAPHDLDVQVTTRERDAKGFKPLPLRWRIEATFGTLTHRSRRLTCNLEQTPAAAEDAIDIANCHRLLKAYHRPQHCKT